MAIVEAIIEVLLAVGVLYLAALLILEAVIWRTQPDMEGGVTLYIGPEDAAIERTLYGFEYQDKLYVSSNHWFRQWYTAVLNNPLIDVERGGERRAYTAVPITGDELAEVARQYRMGVFLRLLCGFAPRRFLRLDLRES